MESNSVIKFFEIVLIVWGTLLVIIANILVIILIIVVFKLLKIVNTFKRWLDKGLNAVSNIFTWIIKK